MEAKNCEANRYKRNSSEGMADSDVNDITLYQRFLSGDDSGLQRLMERYGNSLTLYIDGYLRDIHEAEDLMIEAFAYFVAKRPRLRDDGFRAYLYKSARHFALRCLQKKRRKQIFSFDDLEQEPESDVLLETLVQTDERNRILWRCMDELAPAYREALYLVYFEGMRHAEAAAVMRKTEKQIADLVYRGRASLRKTLEREGITTWYI
ncbi:MAG: RNA polymerase sigma factor [Clostridia bacterium]